jgi:ClpP class serine protease
LLDRVGVNAVVLERGAHASMLSAARPPTDEEREIIRRQVFETYDTFQERVRAGRGMSAEELEPLIGGRVWSGQEALQSGLVDLPGGLPVAVAQARRLAELPADAAAPLRWLTPERRSQAILPQPFPTGWVAGFSWSTVIDTVRRPRILAALPWVLKE